MNARDSRLTVCGVLPFALIAQAPFIDKPSAPAPRAVAAAMKCRCTTDPALRRRRQVPTVDAHQWKLVSQALWSRSAASIGPLIGARGILSYEVFDQPRHWFNRRRVPRREVFERIACEWDAYFERVLYLLESHQYERPRAANIWEVGQVLDRAPRRSNRGATVIFTCDRGRVRIFAIQSDTEYEDSRSLDDVARSVIAREPGHRVDGVPCTCLRACELQMPEQPL
jgi:hypothetical protein